MIKRIITTSTPTVIYSAISGVQAGEQLAAIARGGAAPIKDIWELNGIRRPEHLRIREEAWIKSKDRIGMQEIAMGLEVSTEANKNNEYRIVLRDQSDKKIAEAIGTAEEIEALKAMKNEEERATFMQMKELIEAGKKPGFAGWKARMMYAIKNSKFVQSLATFWARHGNKVKTALKVTGAVALAALSAVVVMVIVAKARGAAWTPESILKKLGSKEQPTKSEITGVPGTGHPSEWPGEGWGWNGGMRQWVPAPPDYRWNNGTGTWESIV